MKNLLFVLCSGIVLFSGVAFASNGLPDDDTVYPAFTTNGIRVATTKHVNTQATATNNDVVTLSNNAADKSATNTTNANNIASIQTNKLDVISGAGNVCPSGQICGYISDGGVDGTKKWITIKVSSD